MTKKVKQLSFEDTISKVEDAVDKQFGNESVWATAVLDNAVIIRDWSLKEWFQASYTISPEEEITISERSTWEPVRLKKEWLRKSFDLRGIPAEAFYIGDEGGEQARVNTNAIKALGENRLGFYGYLWGDTTKKDLHGEWFTEETTGITELFDQLGALPFTYHHASDDTVKATVFGMVDHMQPDEKGVWVEVQITNHEKYRDFIQPLVEEEALYPSSETLVGAKKVKKSGEIQRWVTSFMTGTTMPAEWRMLDHPIDEVKGMYKSIGIDFDPEKGSDVGDDPDDKLETKTEKMVGNQGAAEARLQALIEIESQQLQLLQLETF